MIKVRCHTNIDSMKLEQWPTEMVCRPMVGDSVYSQSGKRLRVCAIGFPPSGDILYVELHYTHKGI